MQTMGSPQRSPVAFRQSYVGSKGHGGGCRGGAVGMFLDIGGGAPLERYCPSPFGMRTLPAGQGLPRRPPEQR